MAKLKALSISSLFIISVYLLNFIQAGDVLTLLDSNFKSEIAKHDLALVKFYAPWCGHCKRLAPEFETAATTLKENDPPVALVDVDCTTEKDICQEHGVSGYPTLKVFRNGVASDFNGGRTASDIVKVMGGQAGPASSEVTSAEKMEKLLNSKANVIAGFFNSDKDEAFKPFKAAAEELRESAKFVHTFDTSVANAAGQEIGTIAIFRPKVMSSKFEEQVVKYSKEKFTVGLIRNWVKEQSKGLAPVVGPEDIASLEFPYALAIFNVDYVKDPKGTQYWRNRVMKVAQNYVKNGLHFACGGKEQWGGFLNEVGADMSKKSPIVVAFTDKDSKYLMQDEFDPKGVAFSAFLDKFEAGELTKHVKTEGDPDNTGKANKVLTATNFDKLVDGSKDALIKFYAPWCGHCKTLAPKWDEMAEEFKDNDNVVIGKFDATANDVPSQFEVSGFPTLYWVKKGDVKNPVKYNSGRETADLVKYVKKHMSVKTEL